MADWVDGLLSLGSSILPGLLTGGSNVLAANANLQGVREVNAQQLDLQRQQWGREDSAMQRRVADLVAAGLNPVLAAGGSGAASSVTARLEAPRYGDAWSQGASGFLSGMAQSQALARTAAETKILDAQARSADAEAETKTLNARIEGYKAKVLEKFYKPLAFAEWGEGGDVPNPLSWALAKVQSELAEMAAIQSRAGIYANQASITGTEAKNVARDFDILSKFPGRPSGGLPEINNLESILGNALNTVISARTPKVPLPPLSGRAKSK